MGYLYLYYINNCRSYRNQCFKEFTQVGSRIMAIIGYGASFYFLSLVLKTIPIGIAYAIWSGIGITLITITGAILFKQMPDIPAIIGMTMIMTGLQ